MRKGHPPSRPALRLPELSGPVIARRQNETIIRTKSDRPNLVLMDQGGIEDRAPRRIVQTARLAAANQYPLAVVAKSTRQDRLRVLAGEEGRLIGCPPQTESAVVAGGEKDIAVGTEGGGHDGLVVAQRSAVGLASFRLPQLRDAINTPRKDQTSRAGTKDGDVKGLGMGQSRPPLSGH